MNQLKEVRDLQDQAKAFRKKGDALRRVGRKDAAIEAYNAGATALTDALKILEPVKDQLAQTTSPVPVQLEAPLNELVETFGALGGMLQRLGLLEASLENYSEGGALESRFGLSSTYNRLNAVKCLLLAGRRQLRELDPQLRELATQIEINLRRDKSLNDSGWAWADLGDCLALLGNLEEARKAYSSFISKSEIKSPGRTLEILKEIASKLEKAADPDASRLQNAITILQSELAAQQSVT